MRKTLLTLTTVAVVGLGSTLFSNPVQAESVNNLQTKQSEIASERSDIKASLSKADGEIADILMDLKEINTEISRVENALKENKAQMEDAKEDITKTEGEISLIEEEIAKLEADIEARFDILKERMTSYQKTGGDIAYLEVLFGSKSFGEFISRVSAVTTITNSDKNLIAEQEEDKAKVEEKQEEVEQKLAEQIENKVELEGMEALIRDQKEQNEASKNSLQKKESKLTSLKANLEGKDSNLVAVEAKIRQDIANSQGINNPVASNAVATNTNAISSNNTVASNNNTVASSSNKGTKSNSATNSPSQSPSKPVASSGGGGIGAAITAGNAHLGTPYQWGGKGPSGFDCSGFVSWAYGQAGYSIPSTTGGLSGVGQKVSYSNIQPGDLVFFNTYKTNGHVGIYVGGGSFIGAQNSTGLAVANMTSGYWNEKFAGHVRRVN